MTRFQLKQRLIKKTNVLVDICNAVNAMQYGGFDIIRVCLPYVTTRLELDQFLAVEYLEVPTF